MKVLYAIPKITFKGTVTWAVCSASTSLVSFFIGNVSTGVVTCAAMQRSVCGVLGKKVTADRLSKTATSRHSKEFLSARAVRSPGPVCSWFMAHRAVACKPEVTSASERVTYECACFIRRRCLRGEGVSRSAPAGALVVGVVARIFKGIIHFLLSHRSAMQQPLHSVGLIIVVPDAAHVTVS